MNGPYTSTSPNNDNDSFTTPAAAAAYPLSYPIDGINDDQLDPSLFALAAQVQAVAHACAQGIDIDIDIDIDPSIAELAAMSTHNPDSFHHHQQQQQQQQQNAGMHMQNGYGVMSMSMGMPIPIDPALLEIAAVVDDVNKGKIRLNDPSLLRGTNQMAQSHDQQHQNHQDQSHPQVEVEITQTEQPVLGAEDLDLSVQDPQEGQGDGEGIQLDGGIDPTLREIVDSLTKAQQQTAHVAPNSLTHAQAAATIGAHITDADERERLQRSLQSTIEDFTQANFNSLFPGNFPSSPNHAFLNLNPEAIPEHPQHAHSHLPQAGPSTLSIPMSHTHADTGPSHGGMNGHDHTNSGAMVHLNVPSPGGFLHELENPLKRGRGRPKGSKNKAKAKTPPRPPKRVIGPPKPKGRPPKVRPPEEQADYELRKQEKAMGIKRQKGRPRKFPGYLVREMRLKKNREEFNQLLNGHDPRQSTKGHGQGDDDNDDGEESDDEDSMMAPLQSHGLTLQQVEAQHQNQTHRLLNLNDIQPNIHGLTMDQVMSQHGLQGALMNSSAHNGHLHHHDGQDDVHDHENDFGSWSVQDGQTLLDVVGMGVGDHGGVSMENMFGLSHHG
ncbi:hypothetical protein I317_04272 [Kwoniella heveanensis CBS 569]|nr:hypothetical protein I317_04272 [Kwoniella heveanensis CBS 569]